MAIAQFESGPAWWDAWLDPKSAAPQLEAQNRFNRDAVKPTRGTSVPCPTATPRMRPGAIHVGAHYVRLNFVVLHLLSRRGMIDRVDEVPKFHGAIAATLQSRREGNPSGSVGILAAVLADARHVSFDVARLKGAFVERRVEQLDQFVSATHQTLLNGVPLPTESALRLLHRI